MIKTNFVANNFPKPVSKCDCKSFEYQQTALVTPSGFREYDARWFYGRDLNLNGVFYVGLGLGTLIKRHKNQQNPDILVGHDYRSYSQSIKLALINGLMVSGCYVLDLGLATTPMLYFAQHFYKKDNMAMVTASHNENGWSGIKMSMQKTLTFNANNMQELKEIVANADFDIGLMGTYRLNQQIRSFYIDDLLRDIKLDRKIRVLVACGNGTAAYVAPQALRQSGVEVIENHCDADFDFPNYNPNPEDLLMIEDVAKKVLQSKADIGFAFDGDGDRCGVIDKNGRFLSADKVGLILARELAKHHKTSKFVVDVKSTNLYLTDPVLQKHNATVSYWKTGHSHIKQHLFDIGALAGFEKSGHFFFNPPYGYGYDDGVKTAINILNLLCGKSSKTIAELYDELPLTFISPTMSPYCDDDVKYDIVLQVAQIYRKRYENGEMVAGEKIIKLLDINGIRFSLEDGGFGLIRASSNKPELVVVTESTKSKQHMRAIFADIEKILAKFPKVGKFNQKIN